MVQKEDSWSIYMAVSALRIKMEGMCAVFSWVVCLFVVGLVVCFFFALQVQYFVDISFLLREDL